MKASDRAIERYRVAQMYGMSPVEFALWQGHNLWVLFGKYPNAPLG